MKLERKSAIKRFSLKALLFGFLFLLSVSIFAVLAHEVVGENEDWFDTRVFNFLNNYSTPFIITFFRWFTNLGSTWFLLIAYSALIVYLFTKKKKEDAITIIIIAVTSTLLLFGLKTYFARHRPPLPLFDALRNYSFPSGHALSFFIFCCVLFFLIRKTKLSKGWKYAVYSVLMVLSLLIGISRIILRYHYASDVVAGFCLAVAWLILSFYLQRKLMINRAK